MLTRVKATGQPWMLVQVQSALDFIFWDSLSLAWCPLIRLARLAWASGILLSLSPQHKDRSLSPNFKNVYFWGLNSSLHACKANVLLTEPLPSPSASTSVTLYSCKKKKKHWKMLCFPVSQSWQEPWQNRTLRALWLRSRGEYWGQTGRHRPHSTKGYTPNDLFPLVRPYLLKSPDFPR